MKTYKLEDLKQKTRLDYEEDNRKMLEHLKDSKPYKEPYEEILTQTGDLTEATSTKIWNLPPTKNPHWITGNIRDPDTWEHQEGCGLIPKVGSEKD